MSVDIRSARDFGGPNVVKHLKREYPDNPIYKPGNVFFTFDTVAPANNIPYAKNQQICRNFARKWGVKIYDVNSGIGTHTLINNALVTPGMTAIGTDSHYNILGAIGAFGQGMGDKDIAAAFSKGKVWFKTPESVKINFVGKRPANISAKDIAINMLSIFGANKLLGYSAEIYGKAADELTLDERITISSMGTEMGTIIILFTPNDKIMEYCNKATGKTIEKIEADADANYAEVYDIDISKFTPKVSLPGAPHTTNDIINTGKVKIDSAFLGSCTNGRISDLRIAAEILKGNKVAPGVILKIVPSTDVIWNQAYDEGLIKIFKDAGALLSNAGCAGCAAGQVGQNGPGEVTVSTGNRNFPGKQGKGDVFLSSPAVVAASALAGYVTTPDAIPDKPAVFTNQEIEVKHKEIHKSEKTLNPTLVEGKVWYIKEDNIDTDMIFHNRYLAITDFNEMGKYIFDNLKGYEDFAKKVQKNDIVVVQKNFGSGSSRQQAVDGFKALGVSVILAESYGAIYERNAINAAMPIMSYDTLEGLNLNDGDVIKVNMASGEVENKTKGTKITINPFSDVQLEIYQNGGLF
jgi:3-isopropylmalate dehydratase small subunit